MSRTLTASLLLFGFLCAMLWVGYSFGYRRGFERALVLDQKGVFVGTFNALQKLRAGQTEAGTRLIEDKCFAAANSVYAGNPESQFIAKTFLQDFERYRRAYRTNSSEWTPTEQSLERRLKEWQ